MIAKFQLILVAAVVAACATFLWGTYSAGRASYLCNAPAPAASVPAPAPATAPEPVPAPEPKPKPKPLPCNAKTGHPEINSSIADAIIPIGATLATYFGAAIGLARKKAGQMDPVTPRIPVPLRWGAVVADQNKLLAALQTIAAYAYLIGLIMAAYYLYRDSQVDPKDSPFTHTIIRSQGAAFWGVLIGVLALVLGVEPASRAAERNPDGS